MTVKSLKTYILLISMLLPSIAMASDFFGDEIGKCYPSIEQYLTGVYGEDYKSDDNLIIKPVKSNSKSEQYLWFLDNNPTVNGSKTLFRITNQKGTCVIFYNPGGYNQLFEKLIKGELPKKIISIDTAPPGFAAHRITFVYSVEKEVYVSKVCERVQQNGIGKSIQIDCRKLFVEDQQ